MANGFREKILNSFRINFDLGTYKISEIRGYFGELENLSCDSSNFSRHWNHSCGHLNIFSDLTRLQPRVHFIHSPFFGLYRTLSLAVRMRDIMTFRRRRYNVRFSKLYLQSIVELIRADMCKYSH